MAGDARRIYGQKWTGREYLMVLHAYFQHRGEAQHANTPFVAELSELLGRTVHSILFRLQNYASIDPEETDPHRKGKAHITEMGRRVFFEWDAQRDALESVAEAFLRDEREKLTPDLFNPHPTRVPVTFRNYELLDEVGRGGFGIVLSCINVKGGQTYALKVIDGDKLHEKGFVHRFGREIRALRGVDHPNVITIHEDNMDSEGHYPGFVMDLAELSLAQYMSSACQEGREVRRPVLGHTEATSIFQAVAGAVTALHESSPPVIHRDVNPNNILRLVDGTWVLADFSLAKFLPPAPVSTVFASQSLVGMGTAHYTSPEQYSALKNADTRSDVFSLGWLLWDLFSAETYPHRDADATGLPHGLSEVYLRATARLPGDRFGSVREMNQAFLHCP